MDRYCSTVDKIRSEFPTSFRKITRFDDDEVLVIATEDTYVSEDLIGRSNVDCLTREYAQLILERDTPYFRCAYVPLEFLDDADHCKDISRVLYYLQDNPVYNGDHYHELLFESEGQ